MVSNLLPKVIDSIESSDSPSKSHLNFSASQGSNSKFTAMEPVSSSLHLCKLSRKQVRLTHDSIWSVFFFRRPVKRSVRVSVFPSKEFYHIDRRRMSQEQGHSLVAALDVDDIFDHARENKLKLAKTVLAAFNDEFTAPPLQILARLSDASQTSLIRDS